MFEMSGFAKELDILQGVITMHEIRIFTATETMVVNGIV